MSISAPNAVQQTPPYSIKQKIPPAFLKAGGIFFLKTEFLKPIYLSPEALLLSTQ